MVQGGEWIVIILVALVVFGPERLPELSRKLGGWARELRTAAREMREGLEAEVSEVKKAKSDLTDPVREVRKAVRDTARLVADTNPTRMMWNGPKPVSGPTPDDALRDLDRIEERETNPADPGAWNGPKPVSGPGPSEDALRDLDRIEERETPSEGSS